MPDTQNMERIEAIAAESWTRWPMKSAAGDAARRSYVRSHLNGEMSYALIERYDAAHDTERLSALINLLLADAELLFANQSLVRI